MSGLAEDLTSTEGHVVQFYDHDDELVAAVTRFAAAGLQLGEGVLVVATPEHRSAFERTLRETGVDLDGYVALDAAEVLTSISGPDGRVDRDRFFDVVGAALQRTVDHPGGHVRVFGEMVALLCGVGARDAAMELESFWNDLAQGPQRFTLLCAYPTPSLDDVERASLYYDACASTRRSSTAPTRRSLPGATSPRMRPPSAMLATSSPTRWTVGALPTPPRPPS